MGGTRNRIAPSFRREFIYRWKAITKDRLQQEMRKSDSLSHSNRPDSIPFSMTPTGTTTSTNTGSPNWNACTAKFRSDASLLNKLDRTYGSTILKVGLAMTTPLRIAKRRVTK